jgi:diacylglycerol kinase (ATP)
MASRTPALFLNPVAGRGRAKRRLPRILALLEETGVHVVVHQSVAVGDLERQVREAVSGGVTELIARRIADGAPARSVDLGRMNGRWFANGAGIGLDARVTQIARAYRWPIGDLVYLAAIFRAMLDGIATPQLLIEADEFRWDGPLTLANIANGPWVGGMFHIAPMAKNDDGWLDLLIAAPVTRGRILQLLPKLVRGNHLAEAEIVHASVQRVTVSVASPVPSHLDGEVQPMQSEFGIEVLPGALRLL